MKKICLIFPAMGEVTVTVAVCWIEFFASMAAVAVYVLVAVGLTICELCGNVHGLQTAFF